MCWNSVDEVLASMLNVRSQLMRTFGNRVGHQEMQMSAIERRRRLHWREEDMQHREMMGRWLDARPLLGDIITLYKEHDRYFLETWFSDGCHSLDPVRLTDTAQGCKVEDVGGNFFGEFFIVTPTQQLQFWNDQGCYYQVEPLMTERDITEQVA